MFNSDKYHWTQDNAKEEGWSILEECLEKQGMKIEDNGSSIYISQRMGKRMVGYDLNLRIVVKKPKDTPESPASDTSAENKEKSKAQRTEYAIEYTSVSEEKDLEETPVKAVFLNSLKEMEKALLSRTEKKTAAKLEKVVIPKVDRLAKTEVYKKLFITKIPKEQIRQFMFKPEIVRMWSNGSISATTSPPFSLRHQALSLDNLSISDLCTTCTGTISNTGASSRAQSPPEPFSLKITFTQKDHGQTAIEIFSDNLPSNCSDRLTYLFKALYFSQIQGVLSVPITEG